VNWRGGARKVVDFIDLDVEGKRDVVPHQLEAPVTEQMRDVAPRGEEEVVHAQLIVALRKQTLAEVRADETGIAGYENSLADRHLHTLLANDLLAEDRSERKPGFRRSFERSVEEPQRSARPGAIAFGDGPPHRRSPPRPVHSDERWIVARRPGRRCARGNLPEDGSVGVDDLPVEEAVRQEERFRGPTADASQRRERQAQATGRRSDVRPSHAQNVLRRQRRISPFAATSRIIFARLTASASGGHTEPRISSFRYL